MTLSEVDRDAVLTAMAEADELGRADFCALYGFGFATTYLVQYEGHFYDPKALVGAAHGHVAGREPLRVADLDATEAVAKLRQLGFEIVDFNGLWWVNQGASYSTGRNGGFVWAPKTNKAGNPVAHHVAVNQLRVGQKVVHYDNGKVRAIGTVVEPPVSHPKPREMGGDWTQEGYLCRVVYRELDPVIDKDEIPNRIPEVGPFDVNGNLKQAYLTKISDAQLFPLLEFLAGREPRFFDAATPADLPELRAQPIGANPQTAGNMQLIHVLLSAKNVVLEGVPGTGKTFAIEDMANRWRDVTGRELVTFGDKRFIATVMHPSTSYEDFIEGLRPTLPATIESEVPYFDQAAAGDGRFQVDDGFFVRVCQKAVRHPDRDVLVLLDELNRCNIPSVLGDLLLALEGSRRATFAGSDRSQATAADWNTPVPVVLPYSRRVFFVPDNVYVVATTNTTDRSVAPIDAAIRRRFSFVRLDPDFEGLLGRTHELGGAAQSIQAQSIEQIVALNESVLSTCVGPDAMLGHSYLFGLHTLLASLGDSEAHVRQAAADVWRYQILSQLIDGLRSFGAEDLLSSTARERWLTDHTPTEIATAARAALDSFAAFLREIGLAIMVDGTGLARGARVVDATVSAAPARVEVGTSQIDIDPNYGAAESPDVQSQTASTPTQV